jgi:hypothetical protein
MRIFLLILFFLSGIVYADYTPATVFPTVRKAKVTVSISGGKFVYTPDCASTDIAVTPTKSDPSNIYCNSCPSAHPEIDYVIVDGQGPDYQRPVCQRPCKANEKRFPRYGGAGYVCMTCNEVWKEWKDDKCVSKTCEAPLVLDTSDGKCKEYDVKCPEWQQKVHSYSTSRPYCTSFCALNEYRSKQGFCTRIPTCQANQKLTFTEEMVKTTSYKEYKCETICAPDENEIDGKCFARCELNEVFEDGQCVSQDGIIRAINRLKNRFTDITYNNIDDLHDLSDSAIEDLETANQDLENFEPNPPHQPDQSNNDYDLTKLEADTPFFNVDTILDHSIFASRNQCPADRSFEIWSTSYDFKFSRICGFLQLLSNLVMAISLVLSYFIIRGR